jgi:hypothetical protein
MKHKITYDEEGILRIQYIGEIIPEEYRQTAEQVMQMPAENLKRILVDISQTDTPMWNRETREMLAKSTPTPAGSKVAVIGASAAIRIISKAFVHIAKTQSQTRFFKTEEEALAWLKE